MALATETKVLAGVLVLTLALIVGGAFLAGGPATQIGATPEPVDKPELLVRDTSASLGPADAKVTVVEFGDYQCPACAALHGPLKAAQEKYADQSVRFVYRHFPLPQHQYAEEAAQAAEAAKAQGKFWEYHDMLFPNQNNLTRTDLEKYAQDVGLNVDEFKRALDEHTYRDIVRADRADGQALLISATPTLYVNGTPYAGQFTADALNSAIDAVLK